jgi:hypothetical protein
MDNASKENRLNSRFAYKHQFTSLIMGDAAGLPEEPSVRGDIEDIGSGGLKIHCGRELKKGAVLLVRIPVNGTEASIPALMAVQWTQNRSGWHAGLKFVIE